MTNSITSSSSAAHGRPDNALYAGFLRLLQDRFSCRAYTEEPVPRPVIEQVLAAAQHTASWCNSQPWKLHIASGATIERLRTALYAERDTHFPADFGWPREYRGVYQERRRQCGWALYEAVGVPKGDRVASAEQGAQNMRFFGAPHVAIISSDEALGNYGAVDCGAYVSNFMLAARSLGLGCIAQAALAAHPKVLRAHLDIREDRLIVCGISFGYADMSHPANQWRTPRADISEAAVWLD